MHGSIEGTKSIPKVFGNIFISFIGAGVLGLPYAFKEVRHVYTSNTCIMINFLFFGANFRIFDVALTF